MKLLLDSRFNQDMLLLKVPVNFPIALWLTPTDDFAAEVTTLITWFGTDFNTWRLVAVAFSVSDTDFGTLTR